MANFPPVSDNRSLYYSYFPRIVRSVVDSANKKSLVVIHKARSHSIKFENEREREELATVAPLGPRSLAATKLGRVCGFASGFASSFYIRQIAIKLFPFECCRIRKEEAVHLELSLGIA